MKDELLKLDVELLLYRYGRQRVLTAIADAEGLSVAELERKLANLREQRVSKASPKQRQTLLDRLESDIQTDPGRRDKLRPLVSAYEAGNLLPTLKAVQRFLEHRGEPKLAVKTRKLAGPAFVKAIMKMGDDEIDTLRNTGSGDGRSDFSLLSQAILGSRTSKPE